MCVKRPSTAEMFLAQQLGEHNNEKEKRGTSEGKLKEFRLSKGEKVHSGKALLENNANQK